MKKILLAILLWLPVTVVAQTPCTISLPYTTGFENDVSYLAPQCWTALSGETYVYDFFYYVHSGSQNLILNSSSGESQIATPRIPLPLNQVGVHLWYVDLAVSSAGLMKVGFVTTLTGTVQWIDTIATCDNYTYVELDYTGLNITDTGYLVFSYSNSSGVGVGMIDDITILQLSDCSPVDNLHIADLSNSEATIEWNESGNEALGYWCYIADTNSRAAAFDSTYLPAGSTSHTFSSLEGNRHYFAWVVSYCGNENSMAAPCSFITLPDCGAVQGLRAITGYRTIGLEWTAPMGGDDVTEYIIGYKPAGDTHWVTTTTTHHCHFITGLEPDSRYDYRVTTVCTDSTGLTLSGWVYTQGCTATTVDSSGQHGSLPISYNSMHSYTQQIYLSNDLTNIDTITGLTFFLSGNYYIDPTPVVVYLANSAKSQFNSNNDYLPVSQLTQVYAGNIINNGREVSIHLPTPFVRQPDSNLIVVIDNNLDDFSNSIPSFVIGNTTTYRAIYRTSMFDISPESPGIGTRVKYLNQIRFNTRGCALPQCERPLVCVTEVGNDHVDVEWNVDSAAEYTCAYRLAGTEVWTVADSGIVSGSYRFTNLELGRDYELRVSRICDTVTLDGYTSISLPCMPVSLPYGEDFELQTVSSVFSRSCWLGGTLSTGFLIRYPTVTTLTGSSNKVCEMTEGYLVLPRFNQPLNMLQIRMNIRQTFNGDRLMLGVLNNIDDTILSATIIDTLAYNSGNSPRDTMVLYRLNDISITDGHLVIIAPQGCYQQYIDNIYVSLIPDCQPVEDVVISSLTTSSATLSWTITEGMSAPTGYLAEYGPRFFTPGTGTLVTLTAMPHVLTGLNHSTDYDLYIYTLCTSDTSEVVGPIRFSTLCDSYSELPYIMDFERIQDPGYTEQNLPTCWYGESVANGSTPTVTATNDSSQVSSGQYTLLFQGSGIVALPLFNGNLNDLKVQFHLYRTAPSASTVIIGTVDSVTPGFSASFVPIDTIPYSTTIGSDNLVTLYLTEYSGTSNRIALLATGQAYNRLYLDDITVDENNDCVAPHHIRLTSRSATSATLSWRVSQAPYYSVEYGPQGFTPGTGTLDTTASQSISLNALVPATTYDVYVTSLCGAENSESSFFTFNTLRGTPVTAYPYHCSFTDSIENSQWELDNGSQRNSWHIGAAALTGSGDSASLYISYDFFGNTHQYITSSPSQVYAYRTLHMDQTSYRVHYDWLSNGERLYDYLRVFLVPGNVFFTPGRNPIGTFTTNSFHNSIPEGWIALDGGAGLSNVTEWQRHDEEIEIPIAGDYFLLFYWLNDGAMGSMPPAAVDNITVTLSRCPAAQGLTLQRVTDSSFTVAWQGNPMSQQYIVEYGQAGFLPGTGTTDTVTGVTYTVGRLIPGSEYDFYVLAQCGEDWYADSTAVLLNIRTDTIVYYTVTVQANNDTYGRVEGSGRYAEGSVATLAAWPAQGYHFTMWDDGDISNPRYLTVVEDITLTAIFDPEDIGIDKPDGEKDFILYPNPATNSVNIQMVHPGAEIVILDICGRERGRFTTAASTATLDLKGYSPGVYFVQMQQGGNKTIQKLIIK